MRRGRRAGVDRDPRRVQLKARVERVERLEDRRRSPACDRRARTAGPRRRCPRRGAGDDRLDLVRRPGEHDLVRAVVDGDVDRAALPRGTPPRPAPVGARRDQPGRGDGAVRFEPRKTAASSASCRSRARSVRMTPAAARAGSSPLLWPGDGVRPEAQPGQDLEHPPLRGEHGGHRRVRRPERLRAGPRGPKRCRLGGTASPDSEGDPVGRVEHRAELGEMRAEVGEHPRILRAFAGEEECEAIPPRRAARPGSRCPGHRGSDRHEGSRSRGSTASRCRTSSSAEPATRPSRGPALAACRRTRSACRRDP